jgi:hypothetical protein
MKNVRKNRIVAIALMAVFIGAIFATALSASVLSTSPVKVMPLAFSVTPSTTLKLQNGTPSANGWNTSAVKVNLTATLAQDAEAIRGMWYSIDKFNVTTSLWAASQGWTKYNATPQGFWMTQNGSWRIKFNSTDAGWHNETTNSTIVKIDQVAPTQTVSTVSTSWYIKDFVLVNVTGVNDTAKWWMNSSGANKTVYTIGTASAVTKYYQNESTGAAGVSINITTQGVNVVNITSYDKAGNKVNTSATVKIDSVAPTTDAASANVTKGWYTFTASDVSSGVATVVVNGTTVTAVGGVYNVTVTNGVNTLVINITDVAGNVLSKTVTITATITPATTPTDWTTIIIIVVIVVVVVVVLAVVMMRRKGGKAPAAAEEAPAAEEKS